MNRGIHFSKIGANITETSQPLDLGPFFNILVKPGRNMTSVGSKTPLSIIVDIILKRLKKDKMLVLSTLKENALKDCVAMSAEMISALFSNDLLTQACVSSSIIDAQTKTSANIYAIIQSVKIV